MALLPVVNDLTKPSLASINGAGVIEIPDNINGLATVTFNSNTASALCLINGDLMYQGPVGSSYTLELPAGAVLTSVASASIFAVYYT